jgi:2-aminophenol/2-amino-5-chlorophenol 1,6-dioxygenase alpha subunit
MTVVSAFLVPGSPLPRLKPETAKLAAFVDALRGAGESLARSRPDAVLVYSTQWIAVLDELWLTRRRSTGIHVDENWYEFGDLPFDIHTDSELATACVAACPKIGIHARGVDYDGFPIDSGTIAAAGLLGMGGADRPLVVAANNVYHDAATTEKLAAAAVLCAQEAGKRVAVVGVGGLSGSCIRTEIDLEADHIENESDDRWNRRVLELMERGDVAELRRVLPEYAGAARVDMGFKHFHWILGALDGKFTRAHVHGYGPLYGTGGAVVEFAIE